MENSGDRTSLKTRRAESQSRIDAAKADAVQHDAPRTSTAGLIRTKAEAQWLSHLLHVAVTDRQNGGLSPIGGGQGAPSVSAVVSVFMERLGELVQTLPDK